MQALFLFEDGQPGLIYIYFSLRALLFVTGSNGHLKLSESYQILKVIIILLLVMHCPFFEFHLLIKIKKLKKIYLQVYVKRHLIF